MHGPVLATPVAGTASGTLLPAPHARTVLAVGWEQPLRGNERHGHPERLLKNRLAYRRGGLKTVGPELKPSGPF